MTEDNVDLVVIGSGPGGMAAACEADKHGLSVVLLDEQTMVGGQIYRNIEYAPSARAELLGKDYAAGETLATEFRSSGADYRGGSTVWNVTPDGTVDYIRADGNSNKGGTGTVKGKFVVMASGAMERPFPIKGWTLPGAMGAGAAQIMLKGAGAVPAGPVILAGCGPLLYLLAWQYLRAGIKITALVETTEYSGYLRALPRLAPALAGWRDLVKGVKLLAAIQRGGMPIYRGAKLLEIEGDESVEALTFVHRRKRRRIPTSLVVLHQGVVPNAQLSLSTGLEHEWDDVQLSWKPITDSWGRLGDTSLYVAGDSRGIVGALASETQGRLAALSIAKRLSAIENLENLASEHRNKLKKYTSVRPFLDILYRPRDDHRIPPEDDVIVCRCEEVTAGQVREFVKLGCLGPNQTKSFGRCGMGPCQGRFCGSTVTEIISKERKVAPEDVGHYRVRSPVKPLLLGDFVIPDKHQL